MPITEQIINTTLVDITSPSGYPTPDKLRQLGVIPPTHALTGITRFEGPNSKWGEFARGGDGFIYAYRLQAQNSPDSPVFETAVKEKCVVSTCGSRQKAESEYRTLMLLQAMGIATPVIYGLDGATIYEQFVVEDKTKQALDEARKAHLLLPRASQLVDVAARLDRAGFKNVRDFTGDMIYDPDQDKFLYIDGGWDIGAPHPDEPSKSGLEIVKKLFPNHLPQVLNVYNRTFISSSDQIMQAFAR